MSERRTILSRPRTKVYESNYNIGESYYKPMVDHLDRKYSGRPLFPSPPREIRSPRRALDEEFPPRDRESAFDRASHIKDDFFERTEKAHKEADAFFDRHGRRTEADSFLDRTHHAKSEAQEFFDKAVTSKKEESFAEKSQSLRNKADAYIEKALSSRASVLDDEIDDQISAQVNRIKASRAASSVARDDDLDFAINAISASADSASQLRARHNQIRVTNINAELASIQERSEARSRRLAEIKSLMAENDALSAMSHAVHDKNVAIRTKNLAY